MRRRERACVFVSIRRHDPARVNACRRRVKAAPAFVEPHSASPEDASADAEVANGVRAEERVLSATEQRPESSQGRSHAPGRAFQEVCVHLLQILVLRLQTVILAHDR